MALRFIQDITKEKVPAPAPGEKTRVPAPAPGDPVRRPAPRAQAGDAIDTEKQAIQAAGLRLHRGFGDTFDYGADDYGGDKSRLLAGRAPLGFYRGQQQQSRREQLDALNRLIDAPSVAEQQYARSADDIRAAMASQARSTPGGFNPATAIAAQRQMAGVGQQLAGDAAIARSQELVDRARAEGDMAGAMRAGDLGALNTEQDYSKALEALGLGYSQLGQADRQFGAGMGAQKEMLIQQLGQAAKNRALGLAGQADAKNAAFGSALGGLGGTLAGLIPLLFASDRRAKTSVETERGASSDLAAVLGDLPQSMMPTEEPAAMHRGYVEDPVAQQTRPVGFGEMLQLVDRARGYGAEGPQSPAPREQQVVERAPVRGGGGPEAGGYFPEGYRKAQVQPPTPDELRGMLDEFASAPQPGSKMASVLEEDILRGLEPGSEWYAGAATGAQEASKGKGKGKAAPAKKDAEKGWSRGEMLKLTALLAAGLGGMGRELGGAIGLVASDKDSKKDARAARGLSKSLGVEPDDLQALSQFIDSEFARGQNAVRVIDVDSDGETEQVFRPHEYEAAPLTMGPMPVNDIAAAYQQVMAGRPQLPAAPTPTQPPSPQLMRGMVPSDVRTKEETASAKAPIRELLAAMEPYSYRYKDPARHGAGERMGVMAQDVEDGGPMGEALVAEGPDGMKYLDLRPQKSLPVMLAALADIDKRLQKAGV